MVAKKDDQAQIKQEETSKDKVTKKESNTEEKETKVKKKVPEKKWWLKDVFLAVVNIIFVAAMMVILGRLPNRANEFRQFRNSAQLATAKSEVDIAEFEIEEASQEAQVLKDLYPNESGLANFASEMDQLKAEGLITSFSFASEQPVRDKTGYYGVPIIVRLTGSWEQISQGLARIEKLPFLFRAVSIETSVVEGNLIEFKYGAFLYVDESLAKTR